MLEQIQVFTEKEAKDIVLRYKDLDYWKKGRVGQGELSSIRVVDLFSILHDNLVKDKIQEKFDHLGDINELYIMRYSIGGKYDEHVDTMGKRVYSFSIPLNVGEYSGGEFFLEGKNVEQKTGQSITFESRQQHGVKPVSEGIRYVIVGWIYKNKNVRHSLM